MVARLIEFGTVVLQRLPAAVSGVPSLPVLLSYASVAADSVAAFSFDDVSDVPGFVPAAEIRSARGTGSLDDCPVLVGRLRAYASSCQLLHPRVSHAHLAYLTTSYAVALGLPFGTAPRMVAQALALRGGLPDPDLAAVLDRLGGLDEGPGASASHSGEQRRATPDPVK